MRDAVHFDPSIIPDRQVTGESSPSARTCSGSSEQTDYRDVQSDLSESSYLALPTKMIHGSVRRTGCAYNKKIGSAEHCRREEESVMQNMCNKRSERLNKPCKNGLCYCYTSDSDDIRQAAPSTSTGDRGAHHHRCSSKPLRKQYMYNLPSESDSSAIVSSDQYFAEKLKAAQEKKKQRRVTLPPESLEGTCKADAKSCRCGHKDKCRRRTFQATNKFEEFHCSDSDAPLIHIIQEVQRNMVVSEIRINRSKLKGKSKKGRSGGNDGGSGGNGGVENTAACTEEANGVEPTSQPQEKLSQTKTKHKVTANPPKTDSTNEILKNARQSEDDGATSDLNSAKPKSSGSKGGRLLMKRVGADVTYKPSNGPPRKPPRNFSSSSDCSSIYSERIKTSSKRSKPKSLSSASSMISECEQPTMPANFLLNQPTPEPEIGKMATKKASNSSLNTVPITKPEIIKPALDRLSLKSVSNKSLNSLASSKSDPPGKPTTEPYKLKNVPAASVPSTREEFTPSCPSYSEIATPICADEMLANDIFPNVPTVPVVIQEPINELNTIEPRKSLSNSDYAKINFAATNDIPNIEAIGWVAPNIFNMLNTETANQKFVSEQPIAQPQQVGWEPPPKLQIDTVDSSKGRETAEDFHNFAFNMACKSTPVKPDIPKDEVTPKNLLREKVKNLPAPTTPVRQNTATKMTPVTEASRSDDEAPIAATEQKSFQKRALRHTKSFLETSKNKIFGLGKRKEEKQNKNTPAKDPPPPSPKTVATQTSDSAVLHGRRLDFEYASDDTLNKRSMTPLGGEEIAAEAKRTHHSDDGFDFNRTVNSPKSDRSKQHNFSPRHLLKNLQPNTEKIAGPEQSYRSYASDYNEDFTVAVQDLLGKARAKLEGEEVTSEIGRDTFTDESVQACVIAAQADIHNEPIYAEIHEQQRQQDAETQSATELPEEVGSEKSSIVYAKVLKRPKVPQPPTPHRPAPQPPTNPQSSIKNAPVKQPRSAKRSTTAPGWHQQQHPESSQRAIQTSESSTTKLPDQKDNTIQSLFQSPIWQNQPEIQSDVISKQPVGMSESSSAPSSPWGSPIPELPSQEERASPHAAQHTTWLQPTPEIPPQIADSEKPISGQQSSAREQHDDTSSPELQQFLTPHGSVQSSIREQHFPQHSTWKQTEIPTQQSHSGEQGFAIQQRVDTSSPEFQQFQTPHGSVQHSLREQHYPQHSTRQQTEIAAQKVHSVKPKLTSVRQQRTETSSPELQHNPQHSTWKQAEIQKQLVHSAKPISARQQRTETSSPELQQFQTPHGSVQSSLREQHYPQNPTMNQPGIPTHQAYSEQQSSALQQRAETPSPEFQQFQTPHGSVQHSLREQHYPQHSTWKQTEISTQQIHSAKPISAREQRAETSSPELQQFQTPHGSVQHSLRDQHEQASSHYPQHSTWKHSTPINPVQQAHIHQGQSESPIAAFQQDPVQHSAWQESQTVEVPEYHHNADYLPQTHATEHPTQLPVNHPEHSRYSPPVQTRVQKIQRPLQSPPPAPQIWSSVPQGPPSPPQSSPSPSPSPPHGHPRGPPSAPPSLASESHGRSLPPSPPQSPLHGPHYVPTSDSQVATQQTAQRAAPQHPNAGRPIAQQIQYPNAEPQYKPHSAQPAASSEAQYPSAAPQDVLSTPQHQPVPPTSIAGQFATPQHSIMQYPLACSPHTPSAPPFSPPGPQHPVPTLTTHGPSHTSTPGPSSSAPQQPAEQDLARSSPPTVEPAATPSTSFNNCRERHSLPKARALSKSDLSQQGSEIFLENLYHMKNSNISPRSDDEKKSNLDEPIAVSQFFYYDDQRHGNSSNSYSSDADSSKPSSDDVEYEEPCGDEMPHKMPFGYDTVDYDIRSPETASYLSCQSCLDKDENMNISPTKNLNNATTKSNNKYANLKFKIRSSFRKGRNYLKNERKRLSLALDRGFSRSDNAIDSKRKSLIRGGRKGQQSDFEVDYVSALELLNETSKDDCVKRQLEQAVSICRQLPEFEASSEMVEAERLLLYSTLKENSNCKSNESIPSHHSTPKDFCGGMISITSFEIPIKPDIHYDAFFNYFYIGVFSNGQDIRSTQSAEKVDDAVFFPNCNMLFDDLTANFEINVDLYVLRLRKLSAPPIEKENVPVKIRKSSLSDSREEVVSRFRMHGNFIVRAQDLGPYEVKSNSEENITQNSEFSLIANNLCSMPISLFSRNINLSNEVWLTANVAYRFKNFELRGFLNVGDINRKHDWNKRWCQIDALTLYFWNYPQECSEIPPILTINLAKCVSYPIKSANREICPKPRSFQLNITNGEIIDGEPCTDTFLFSTENQEDFGYWVNGLNDVVEFGRTWKVQLQ